MIVFDRLQATQDPFNPEEYLVTIFWRDPVQRDELLSGHASRNHSVDLYELAHLKGRMSKIGFTPSGEPVRLRDSR